MGRRVCIGLAAAVTGLVSFAGASLAGDVANGDAAGAGPRFVVHEWGVLVLGRTAAGTELGPPAELPGQLPPFVPSHEKQYKPKRQDHGWDKPVLYFYGPEGLAVKVRVETPLGRPLAYWPAPDGYTERPGKAITSKQEMMIYSLTEATGMRWEGTLSAAPARPPEAVAAGHWWSAARDVPAAWLNTRSASERFVFYEATARREPVVKTRVSDDAITVENPAGGAASGPVLVLLNDGAKHWGAWVEDVPAGKSVTVSKQDVLAKELTAAEVLDRCARQWRAMGMTPAEAEAIVKVWKPDLLNTVGFLAVARMPADAYGKMFPLTVEPKPDELVRVGLVFDVLAGQDTRAGWLPGLKATLDAWAKDLAAADYHRREAAAARFERMGDLCRPYLKDLTQSGDPEVTRAAALLLRQMEPPATRPAAKGDGPRAENDPFGTDDDNIYNFSK